MTVKQRKKKPNKKDDRVEKDDAASSHAPPKKDLTQSTSAAQNNDSNGISKKRRKGSKLISEKAKKKLMFAVGIFVGLCLPVILNYFDIVNVRPMYEFIAPIQAQLDETKAVVFEFMNRMNISLDLADIDPRSILDNIYGVKNISDLAPGIKARQAGLQMHYPIVIIPGFTSSGLEIWDGEDCLKHYFRQRVWGTTSMLHAMLSNRECWLRHMALDPDTGLDPPGRKIRASKGLEAADYVFGGYWVWGKVIENLAEIGYTSNDMYMASYDWRLSPWAAERRDSYMTRLKTTFELNLKIHGIPSLVMSHSYGSQVAYAFMKWVESPNGGNGGPDWVDKHIAVFINIAGSMLGVPKAVSAILSGEFKDTAQLGTMSAALDFYISPEKRAELIRTWGSIITMLPKGGNAVWGNTTWAPDDILPLANYTALEELNETGSTPADPTYGIMLSFTPDTLPPVDGNMTWDEAWDNLILPRLRGSEFTSGLGSSFVAADIEDLATNENYDKYRYWTNPLASSLPNAPHMKIWCMYGVNQSAERGYLYRTSPYSTEDESHTVNNITSVPYTIFNSVSGESFFQGLRLTEGDGTVPLLSLGYMCNEGWTNTRYPYNPGKVEVATIEYPHAPTGFSLRGGGKSSDHIDILGNTELLEAVMSISAGRDELVESRLISNIKEIASSVDLIAMGSKKDP